MDRRRRCQECLDIHIQLFCSELQREKEHHSKIVAQGEIQKASRTSLFIVNKVKSPSVDLHELRVLVPSGVLWVAKKQWPCTESVPSMAPV